MPIWSRYRYRVEDYWPLIQVLRQSNKYTHGVLIPLPDADLRRSTRRTPRALTDLELRHPPSALELEDLALQSFDRELRREGMTALERREDDRQHFRYLPDLTSPDMLTHRERGPHQVKGSRVIDVPEGWVVLGRKPLYRGLPELLDLRCAPSLRLTPFVIRWRPEFSDQKLGRAWKTPGRVDQTLPDGRLSLQINRDFVRLKLRIVREMTGRKHFYERSPGGTLAAWKKEGELIKGINAVTRELIAARRWAFVDPGTYSAYDTEVRRRVRGWLTSVRHHRPDRAQIIVSKYVVPWRYNPRKDS